MHTQSSPIKVTPLTEINDYHGKVHGLIAKYFESSSNDGEFMTASEVCQALMRLESPTETPVEFNPIVVGKALLSLGFRKSHYVHKRFDYPVNGYPVRLVPQFQTGDDLPF